MQPIWRTQPGTSRTGHPPHRDSDDGGMAGSPPGPGGDPVVTSSDGMKHCIGGDGTLKRLRCYSNDGYVSGDGDGKTAGR
jgi:hypothetical protein